MDHASTRSPVSRRAPRKATPDPLPLDRKGAGRHRVPAVEAPNPPTPEPVPPAPHALSSLNPSIPRPTRHTLDRLVHAMLARATLGLSPASVMQAYGDWLWHIAISPGKQSELIESAVNKATRLLIYASRLASDPECPACAEPLAQDKRFATEDWKRSPFTFLYQSFLLTEQW